MRAALASLSFDVDLRASLEAFVSDCYLQSSKDTVIGVTHGGVLADFLLNVFSSEKLSRISPKFCNAHTVVK